MPSSRTAPPPLLQVNVELPAWPVLERERRRLDAVRSATGRVATACGAVAAAAGLFTAEFAGASLLATVAASGAGLATLRLWKPGGHQKATATALYLMPGTGLVALLLAEQVVAGIHWGEALALAVWTVATGLLRPARLARRMMCPPPPPSVELAPVDEAVDAHPAARWWAANVAVDGGAAAGTVLEDVQRTGEQALRAVIRCAVPGEPVPDISVRRLSALMDIPEEEITIGPVPGRGASVRLLRVGQADETELDAAAVWAKRIAPTAMPGTVLTGIRIGRPEAGPTTTITTATATTAKRTETSPEGDA
ncbi:hypothetical protein AB0J28_01760 [Streptosporangium canum]|uniref:hypothetical protein n=1 Tax=Streptosporangium canum TaxID=324952 RepID=UPI00342E48A0